MKVSPGGSLGTRVRGQTGKRVLGYEPFCPFTFYPSAFLLLCPTILSPLHPLTRMPSCPFPLCSPTLSSFCLPALSPFHLPTLSSFCPPTLSTSCPLTLSPSCLLTLLPSHPLTHLPSHTLTIFLSCCFVLAPFHPPTLLPFAHPPSHPPAFLGGGVRVPLSCKGRQGGRGGRIPLSWLGRSRERGYPCPSQGEGRERSGREGTWSGVLHLSLPPPPLPGGQTQNITFPILRMQAVNIDGFRTYLTESTMLDCQSGLQNWIFRRKIRKDRY